MIHHIYIFNIKKLQVTNLFLTYIYINKQKLYQLLRMKLNREKGTPELYTLKCSQHYSIIGSSEWPERYSIACAVNVLSFWTYNAKNNKKKISKRFIKETFIINYSINFNFIIHISKIYEIQLLQDIMLKILRFPALIGSNTIWRPPSLSELTPIFSLELTYLDSETSIYHFIFLYQ